MIKTYRKGRTTYYKAPGLSIAVDDDKRSDLLSASHFLSSVSVSEEASAPARRSRKATAASTAPKAPKAAKQEPTEAGEQLNMADEIAGLILAGVNTEEGMVKALNDKLLAAGKKSPARSVNTALRHAKARGAIKESVDGVFSIPAVKAV